MTETVTALGTVSTDTMLPWSPGAVHMMAAADPREPNTWPAQVEDAAAGWENIEPYCVGRTWQSTEERYRAVALTVAEMETARAMAFCDAVLDALRSRVVPSSVEARLLSRLQGALMHLRDVTVDATLHAAHTLGMALPEGTTDDDLLVLARQVVGSPLQEV